MWYKNIKLIEFLDEKFDIETEEIARTHYYYWANAFLPMFSDYTLNIKSKCNNGILQQVFLKISQLKRLTKNIDNNIFKKLFLSFSNFVKSESDLSSKLENIVIPLIEYSNLVLKEKDNSKITKKETKDKYNFDLIQNYISLLSQIKKGDVFEPTDETINYVHSAILGHNKDVGFRSNNEIEVISYSQISFDTITALYFAPVFDEYDIQLKDWIRTISKLENDYSQEKIDKYEYLLTSIVLNQIFVAIHPFNDGNGRFKRFLMQHHLVQAFQLDAPIIQLSSAIMATNSWSKNTYTYFDYNFLESITDNIHLNMFWIHNAIVITIQAIEQWNEEYNKTKKILENLFLSKKPNDKEIQLVEKILSTIMIENAFFSKDLFPKNISAATAFRYINQLVESDLINKVSSNFSDNKKGFYSIPLNKILSDIKNQKPVSISDFKNFLNGFGVKIGDPNFELFLNRIEQEKELTIQNMNTHFPFIYERRNQKIEEFERNKEKSK